MPIQLLMPALSPTMEKGNLAKWLKKEGDAVKTGDVIAEIETDKATMEVEAIDDGTLGRILVPEGTNDVAVNTPIATIFAEGEDKTALTNVPTPQPKAAETAPPVVAEPAKASPPAAPKTAVAEAPAAAVPGSRKRATRSRPATSSPRSRPTRRRWRSRPSTTARSAKSWCRKAPMMSRSTRRSP